MPCYSPLKGWKHRETGGLCFRRELSHGEEMEVACGQCLGCRLDKSRMWAMRIVHESSMHEYNGGNCFITLTYRDRIECTREQLIDGYYIPDDWSLDRKHFVDFMKRLRSFFGDAKLKFYMCGEYGNKCKHGLELDKVGCPLCNVGRPHYHACLFGATFPDLEPYSSRDGELRYTSAILERLWRYGFVDVGELNFDSAAYVSRYCLKKVTGDKAHDHYMSVDLDGEITWLEPEYSTMSRGNAAYKGQKCGIGADWYDVYGDDVFPSDEVPVPGSGVYKKVPRYYEEIFKEENPISLEEIKAIRKKFREVHGDEYTPERLMDKYKVKKAQMKMLKREL